MVSDRCSYMSLFCHDDFVRRSGETNKQTNGIMLHGSSSLKMSGFHEKGFSNFIFSSTLQKEYSIKLKICHLFSSSEYDEI